MDNFPIRTPSPTPTTSIPIKPKKTHTRKLDFSNIDCSVIRKLDFK